MDHRLLCAKVNSVAKPKVRANKDTLPKRIDVSKLKIPSVQNEFVSEINNLPCEENCNLFKESVYEICSNILGFVMKKHQDWFGDNEEEIGLILEEKQKEFNML
ncbi:Hypothetical predicted protein [Octopus vulgaris]|uniref:Uncharacterized protein n=1 Tax=Octopus vulgaris TaxID=6645 RepID=A0AA36AJI0_OCTVU|nr:Hypothetical predicted protein [Octopus vulgaris]